MLFLLHQHNEITKPHDCNNRSHNYFSFYIFFDFDLPKNVDENLKHKIDFIIKSNESFAQNKIENKIEQPLLKNKHGHNTLNKENRKTSEPHKFILNSSKRFDLRGSNTHAGLQNIFIYYMWGNKR